jgi:hypothetical protein
MGNIVAGPTTLLPSVEEMTLFSSPLTVSGWLFGFLGSAAARLYVVPVPSKKQ